MPYKKIDAALRAASIFLFSFALSDSYKMPTAPPSNTIIVVIAKGCMNKAQIFGILIPSQSGNTKLAIAALIAKKQNTHRGTNRKFSPTKAIQTNIFAIATIPTP